MNISWGFSITIRRIVWPSITTEKKRCRIRNNKKELNNNFMLIKPNHSVMRIIASTLQFICFSGCILAQDMKSITLNPPDLKRGLPVMEAFSLRASATEFSDKKLTLQDLSDLLFAANGINRKDVSKRTAPSAMNTQDVWYLCVHAGRSLLLRSVK